jgi:hypothetical protein
MIECIQKPENCIAKTIRLAHLATKSAAHCLSEEEDQDSSYKLWSAQTENSLRIFETIFSSSFSLQEIRRHRWKNSIVSTTPNLLTDTQVIFIELAFSSPIETSPILWGEGLNWTTSF